MQGRRILATILKEGLKSFVSRVRNKIGSIPDASIRCKEQSHGPGGDFPVEIKIIGDNISTLTVLTEMVKNKLSGIRDVYDIETSIEEGRPELQIKIDRKKAADFGFSVREVAGIIESYVSGTVMYF